MVAGGRWMIGEDGVEVAIKFPRLAGACSEEELAVHRAALEWGLDAPILIRDRSDIKSAKRWADKIEPYEHQIRNLITFCRRKPVTLLADDVGLGKTVSAGLILSELMERKAVKRALVVCPKLLLPQWAAELDGKFGVTAFAESGAKVLPHVSHGVYPVVVTTYHTFANHAAAMKSGRFDMVILDEAHKLRNLHGTNKPPKIAEVTQQMLLARAFKFVLMLTATPIQNKAWDIYSLVDLLCSAKGHTNPLGSPAVFKAKYLADDKGWQVAKGTSEEFRRHISNYMVRTRKGDTGLAYPSRTVEMVKVKPAAAELAGFQLVADLLNEGELDALTEVSLGVAVMSSPQALLEQLKKMEENGTVSAGTSVRYASSIPSGAPTAKLEALWQLVSRLREADPQGWRLVVFTTRNATIGAIESFLGSKGIAVGTVSGGKGAKNQKSVAAFREEPPMVRVLVSGDAGAEGVNLQVCNVLVNFDLPWNPMIVEQRIGRVQRLASKHAEVRVLNLVLAGSVEESVVARLLLKLQAIAETIGDVESILESAGEDGDSDAGGFEEKLKRMVLAALRKSDYSADLKAAEDSIARGKQLYENEKKIVDESLGNLGAMHKAGPQVPDIEPFVPSMPHKEFVRRAVGAEGGRIEDDGFGGLSMVMPGHRPVPVVLEESSTGWAGTAETNVFTGNQPRDLYPGRPPFEQMVGKWGGKCQALVARACEDPESAVRAAVESWADERASAKGDLPSGIEVVSVRSRRMESRFVGRLDFKATGANGFDRLEKLVSVQVGGKGSSGGDDAQIPDCDAEGSEVSLKEICGAGIESVVERAVRGEGDLKKFNAFHLARMVEEVEAAKSVPMKKSLEEKHRPMVTAELLAARGRRIEVHKAAASLRVGGVECGEVEFSVEVPARTLVEKPEMVVCAVSGAEVPAAFTEKCAVTDAPGLRHLMLRSEESGKLVTPGACVRCGKTGVVLLPSEVEACAVSGLLVRPSLLVKSGISRRRALEEHTETCEFTGKRVLSDEATASQISHKKFRNDQRAISVLSERVGHISEFVESVQPGGLLAVDEATKSDCSGEFADTTLILRSERPPHRVGFPWESTRCESTNRLLLKDEVAACEASKKVVDDSLLVESAVSGARGLPEAMLRCAKSNAFLLPREAEACAVSGLLVDPSLLVKSGISKRCALEEHLVSCEFTGKRALPDELAESDVSKRMFRHDQRSVSVLSGRAGHASEFVESREPKGLLAIDEAAKSDVSGEWADAKMVVRSARPPHRVGFPWEIRTCSATGAALLSDEVALSDASGKLVDSTLLVKSAESKRRALASEMSRCAVTGDAVLPDELAKDSISGALVKRSLLAPSAASGLFGLKSSMLMCSVTKGLALPSELERCTVTGLMALATEMETCSVTSRRACRGRMKRSNISGNWAILDADTDAALSSTGVAGPSVVRCGWTGRVGLKSELKACTLCRMRVGFDQLNIAGELEDLRRVLDVGAAASAMTIPSDVLGWVRFGVPGCDKVRSGARIVSPDGTKQVIRVDVPGVLGFFGVAIGMIASANVTPTRLLAGPFNGKVKGGVWVPVE